MTIKITFINFRKVKEYLSDLLIFLKMELANMLLAFH